MSVWSLNLLTPCQRSQQLIGHHVSVVNDYADTCQVSVVNNYTNIVSVKSTTTLALSKLFYFGKIKKTNIKKSSRSQPLCRHRQDYADTFGKLLRFLKDLNQAKKSYLGAFTVYTPNSNNLKIWKSLYLKKKMRVLVVVDYGDTRFSNIAIEYLNKNEKVRETVFASLYRAQVESFKQKKIVENLVTLSF